MGVVLCFRSISILNFPFIRDSLQKIYKYIHFSQMQTFKKLLKTEVEIYSTKINMETVRILL